jgi:hypothetical protein
MLPPVPRDDGASAEHIVTRMGARLEESIQAHSLSETTVYA